MKTATIERSHCYGTPRYQLSVRYLGKVLQWRDETYLGYITAHAYILDDGADAIERARTVARRYGFTHCRFTGDWSGRTKPSGGKL